MNIEIVQYYRISNSAKVTYNTLAKCNTSISGGCTIPAGTYNQTYLDNCLTKFKAVSTKNAECLALISAASANISAACTCYAAALKLVNEVKASKCSAKQSFDNIKVAKDKCLGNFSTCKKAEDSTVGLIQSCNGKTTPAPLTTVAAATTTTTTKTTTKAAAPAPAPATTAAATGRCYPWQNILYLRNVFFFLIHIWYSEFPKILLITYSQSKFYRVAFASKKMVSYFSSLSLSIMLCLYDALCIHHCSGGLSGKLLPDN